MTYRFRIYTSENNIMSDKVYTTTKDLDIFDEENICKSMMTANTIMTNINMIIKCENYNKYIIKHSEFDIFTNYYIKEINEDYCSKDNEYVNLHCIIIIKYMTFIKNIISYYKLSDTIATYLQEDYDFIYISNTETKSSELKIHLMVKPEFHTLLILLLIFIFKDQLFRFKTHLRFFETKINNVDHKEFYDLNYREASVVIYTRDIDDFFVKLNLIHCVFKNSYKIIGLNLSPAFNIKINEMIYYAIGTRSSKLETREDIDTKYNNYKISNITKQKWLNCTNKDVVSCETLSPYEKRFSPDTTLCKFYKNICIPRPLITNQRNFVIKNEEKLNKYNNMCIDDLCFQEYNKYDITIEDVEERLQTIPELYTPDNIQQYKSSGEKYMKYKTKYLKLKKLH
jgi:hypothetical protein